METLEKFSHCRFFDGGSVCPYSAMRDRSFWGYERHWVETPDEEFEDMVSSYRRFGLADFATDDGVPETLKAFLWSRFIHWFGAEVARERVAEAFKHWYLTFYLVRPIL